MLTVTLKSDVAEQITRLAHEGQTDADTLVDRAVRSFLSQAQRIKLRAEQAEFERQKSSLLLRYRGQYIAMHAGQVIDHDADLRTLYLRVYARLTDTTVLLKRVTAESERELVIRSPKLERAA